MNSAEKIINYIHKLANKHKLSYEEAEKLAIAREYIKNAKDDFDKEGNST